jgi:outer membrane receptor protein involved in Fe transport
LGKNYSTNIALEFGLFHNKLFGTIEYFNRDSKDLLQNVPISTITGFGSILRNVGEMNNKGIEIELGSDIVKNENWKWTLSANAAIIKSKITNYMVDVISSGMIPQVETIELDLFIAKENRLYHSLV